MNMKLDMTPRMKQIILILLRESGITDETIMEQENINHTAFIESNRNPIPVKKLAEEMNVSKRTIQRELEYLGTTLKRYQIEFKSKTGIGVWIEGEVTSRIELLKELQQDNTLDATNRTERRKRLILEILKDKTPKKLYYYSTLFGVSEATISTDLEAIEEWFSAFDLMIIRKQGYGIVVEGSEKNYRQAMRTFIDENMDTEMIKEIYEDKNQVLLQLIHNKSEKNIYGILNDDILKRVVACILEIQDSRIMNLTESSYVGLVLHVTIAINRILKEEMIEYNQELVQSLIKGEEYKLAKEIINKLEKEFEISIPEIETAYICLHIKGSKKQYIENESNKTISTEQVEQMELVNHMIDAYDKEMAYYLKQDEEFIRGLVAHLQPTQIRLTNGMKIKNPLLDEIKENYNEIYKKCKKVAEVMEERLHCVVPESEIGFLAIHFGAAIVRMENQKESKRKVYVGIVCASGIGISRLMSTKITRYFMDRVEIDTYGKNDISPYVLEKTDFFVSSISLHQDGMDVIFVSPLLPEQDMEEIEKRVKKYERIPKKKIEENAFTRQLDQVNHMAVQIKSMIKEMKLFHVEPNITFPQLLQELSEELTPYQERQKLIQENIQKREQLGTQIFPEFGFALLHTKTQGVIRPNFSVCLTEGKDSFQDAYFKKIRVVILMLLPVDEYIKENSQMLGYLSEMLIEDYKFLDTIIEGEEEKIRELLSKYLKQFFHQYLDGVS